MLKKITRVFKQKCRNSTMSYRVVKEVVPGYPDVLVIETKEKKQPEGWQMLVFEQGDTSTTPALPPRMFFKTDVDWLKEVMKITKWW